jgi:16S rRNA (guanine1516-N2)-methyltransferase
MTLSSTIIAVAADSAALNPRADDLALELDLPRCELPCSEYPHILIYSCSDSVATRLEFRATHQDAPGPVYVDFVGGALGFRSRRGNRTKEPLARAIGLKGRTLPTVLDATAGLGRDAFILATLGCRVILVERSPLIAALLRDGLVRALADDNTRAAAERMQLHRGDAVAIMERCAEHDRPDVIYLDPMYPHRSKSALVKKEMRVVRALVGEDMDAPQLLEAALRVARKRVVVKRPRSAPALPGIAPSHSLLGSTTRFDVYVRAHGVDKG